jgi:hypothetical protein
VSLASLIPRSVIVAKVEPARGPGAPFNHVSGVIMRILSRAEKRRIRRGFTLMEIQVSFALLGIGLAGLCPLVVMQLRQIRSLELRLQGQVIEASPVSGQSITMLAGTTYYLVPWQNPWTRKLAGSGQVVNSTLNLCDPGSLRVPSPAPQSYPLTIVELDAPPYSESVTAYVDVSAP